MLSNQLRADQAILTGTPAFSLDNANYLLDYSHLAQMRMIFFFSNQESHYRLLHK